ncbi:MAG TPA: hypothetical protein PKI73_10005, partial [Petrotogaceae bacterium]|nr:hypothetical protein [Petrotogaceae bacterium]
MTLKFVKNIYENSSELKSIGSLEDYNNYINQVFPLSNETGLFYRADKRINLDEESTIDDYTMIMP